MEMPCQVGCCDIMLSSVFVLVDCFYILNCCASHSERFHDLVPLYVFHYIYTCYIHRL